MAAFVRFWGTRGSIPTPGQRTKKYGGNTSCVEIRIDDTLFVCDGGTGLRELGLRLATDAANPVEAHMFFSHMHWDHIQGFPFFVPAYDPRSKLHVYEWAKGSDRVQKLLHGQMRSEYFPVTFTDLGADMLQSDLGNGEKVIDGVTVRCFEQHHPGQSFAFSFEKNGQKVVYATDNEIDLTLSNHDASLKDLDALRKVPDAFVKFVAGADLLIADGQYTDAEYPRKIGWGHARTNTVADLAVQAGVKQCAIFHHDPMQSDDDVEQKVEHARQRVELRGANITVFGAREGLELKL